MNPNNRKRPSRARPPPVSFGTRVQTSGRAVDAAAPPAPSSNLLSSSNLVGEVAKTRKEWDDETTIADWLEGVRPGYARFAPGFEAWGYTTFADLNAAPLEASEVSALVEGGGGKKPQSVQIIRALPHFATLEFTPWLDSIRRGYGERFGAALAAAGYEDEEDLRGSQPSQHELHQALAIFGAKRPQLERLAVAFGGTSANTGRDAPSSSAAGPDTPTPSVLQSPMTSGAAVSPTPVQEVPSAATTMVAQQNKGKGRTPDKNDSGWGDDSIDNSVFNSNGGGGDTSRSYRGWSAGGSVAGTPAKPDASSTPSAATTMAAGKRPHPLPALSEKKVFSAAKPAPSTTFSAHRLGKKAAASGPPIKPRSSQQTAESVEPPLPLSARTELNPGDFFKSGKHVMLSYQWDNQAGVLRARKMFVERGVPCWMDVDNMQVDIYDSMAAGVQGAAVLICFMSKRYQESANCKLELKFAQQSGVPIVPVMMQKDYAAGGWLGIISAGKKWTPLYDDATFEDGIEAIITEIRHAVPDARPASEDYILVPSTEQSSLASAQPDANSGRYRDGIDIEAWGDSMFSLQDMRDELDRLRSSIGIEITKSKRGDGDGSGEKREGSVTSDGSGSFGSSNRSSVVNSLKCPIPAAVPDSPPWLLVTEPMSKLLSAVLAGTRGDENATQMAAYTTQQVGFVGMGGVGKTTISTWIVREAKVRESFDTIAWITLGQSPDIKMSTNILHMQLTGIEMQPGLSAAEAQQALTNAFSLKNVLLVVDDCWEAAHAKQLAFLDDATDSKVLISSRVRHVLEGGEIIDISHPTLEDQIKMLLAAAGVTLKPRETSPVEASKVVRLCNGLPLAIGIAGRLIRDMLDETNDWDGVFKLLQEEFGASDHGKSMEERIILTSLNAIPESQQAGVFRLFHGFALVAEDTAVPLDVLGMVFEASGAPLDAGSLPKRVQIRRWLKMLIDRSLILGTVDRPQLHDVVLDFVLSKFSPDELRAAQVRFIDVVRASRPSGGFGWSKFNCSSDPATNYIVHQLVHHVRAALPDGGVEQTERNLKVQEWLDDYVDGRSDAVGEETCRALGAERVNSLIVAAAAAHDYWAATIRSFMLSSIIARNGELIKSLTVCRNSIDFYSKVIQQCKSAKMIQATASTKAAVAKLPSKEVMGLMELQAIISVLRGWGQDDLFKYGPRFNEIMESDESSITDPMLLNVALMCSDFYPPCFTGPESFEDDPTAPFLELGKGGLALTMGVRALLPDPRANVCFNFCASSTGLMLLVPGFDPTEAFGVEGECLEIAAKGFDYESQQADASFQFSANMGTCMPAWSWPMLCIWGKIEKTRELLDIGLHNFTKTGQDVKRAAYAMDLLLGVGSYAPICYMLGEWKQYAKVMQFCNLGDGDITFATADTFIASLAEMLPVCRKWGSKEKGFFFTPESIAWTVKLGMLLCETAESTPEMAAKVLSELPPPHEFAQLGMSLETHDQSAAINLHFNCFPALALEKYGQHDKALQYANMCLTIRANEGMSMQRWTKIVAWICRGRIHALQGKLEEAEEDFAKGEELARVSKQTFFLALVVRECGTHVLIPTGKSHEAASRLQAALADLVDVSLEQMMKVII